MDAYFTFGEKGYKKKDCPTDKELESDDREIAKERTSREKIAKVSLVVNTTDSIDNNHLF